MCRFQEGWFDESVEPGIRWLIKRRRRCDFCACINRVNQKVRALRGRTWRRWGRSREVGRVRTGRCMRRRREREHEGDGTERKPGTDGTVHAAQRRRLGTVSSVPRFSRRCARTRRRGETIMRFMMLMIPKGYETAAPGAMPDPKAVAAMMKYTESMQKTGVRSEERR